MEKYAIVRTDNMSGTYVGKDLVSLRADKDIENGSVVVVGALEEGEREVRTMADMAATSKLSELAVIAGVEVIKDKKYNALSEFINETGDIVRGYRLVSKDLFSVTKEAFKDGAKLAVGNIVECAAGRKMNAVASATASTTAIGKIIAIEGEYYVIEVA